MRILFIGQKGMPATFGGIEYHVDELTRGLAGLGNDVRVYVRDWYTDKNLQEVEGVRLVHVPTIQTKHLDASLHSFLSSMHAVFQKPDIIHYHAIGPSFFSLIPRLLGKKVVATVHRLDWQTEKWGPVARFFLRIGEHISARVPNRTIVVSQELKEYFKKRYGSETVHIPHGIDVPKRRPASVIREKYGLSGRDYVLFMGRLVPEKRVDWLVDAFIDVMKPPSKLPSVKLVIAGGSSSTDAYAERVRTMSTESPDILFTGYVTGEEKEELLSNAVVLVLPSYLEGFPIVLLEAKSYGICCLASDIAPHREAIRSGTDGMLFSSNSKAALTEKLRALLSDPDVADRLGGKAREEMERRPSWREIVGRTMALYHEVSDT